jgi:hypothetical protein
MEPTALTPASLASLLAGFKYRFTTEEELQRGIEQVLRDQWIGFKREYRLNKTDRPDFLVMPDRHVPGERTPGIAVEVKIGGSAAEVTRQVHRYLQHEEVAGVMLVTSRFRHQLPAEINGKPVAVFHIAVAW